MEGGDGATVSLTVMHYVSLWWRWSGREDESACEHRVRLESVWLTISRVS